MLPFPSEQRFASFLRYSPRGTSDTSAQSRVLRDKIKHDGHYGAINAIDRAVLRISERISDYPFLEEYLNSNVLLIPVPRSSPQQAGTLWPADRICRSLLGAGLGLEVRPCLNRIKPVQKAAFAGTGNRPEPQEHWDSTTVDLQKSLHQPKTITLVDDFVTRGSSFIGMAARVRVAFPGIPVLCFALVRTMSGVETSEPIDPVMGTITYKDGTLLRQP